MKDVRLAAFDLDGTLLDSANKISDFTIRQIQKAIDRGIEIVIATGRSVPLFPEELKRVSGIRYAIVEKWGRYIRSEKSEISFSQDNSI